MRARKGGCVRWFFIIWVNQVGFGKSFAARRGRFWLASATGYRPIRHAGERLGLVPDKLLACASEVYPVSHRRITNYLAIREVISLLFMLFSIRLVPPPMIAASAFVY